jgi:hypothetical protein
MDEIMEKIKSLSPEERQEVLEKLRNFFDPNFCINRFKPKHQIILSDMRMHSTEELRTMIDHVPTFSDFVVVEHSGQENEKVVKAGFKNSMRAINWMERNYNPSDRKLLKPSVMLRLENGELTTEY